MGLRERNAAYTRQAITETALTLFVERGYEQTTMEEIAERAEVSTSTLYRYFPSKDLLVVEPLALRGQMAAELLDRPTQEPLELALGHALRALLATPRPDTDGIRQLGTVIEATPSLRARLLEEFDRERLLLQEAIAHRLGRPADDLFCRMTARLTMSVLELVGERDPTHSPPDNQAAIHEAVEFVRSALDQLRVEPPVLPRLEPA